jgi:poly(hydroxyalkanoate) depolymerase family esterase
MYILQPCMFRRRPCTLVLAVALVLTIVASPAQAGGHGRGRALTFTHGSGAAAHPYIVYVPGTHRARRHAPLVVFAHGCQTTAEQQMRASLYNRVADREGFIVLYPDVNAAEVAQPGPLTRCWQFFNPSSWHRGQGDPAAIAGMTRTVMARWHVNPERVYMVGMSAGGFMTSIMAAAYPELFAAVGVVAAGAYADSSCLLGNPGMPVATSAQLAFAEMGSRARVIPRLVMGGDVDGGITPPCADKALEQGLRTNNLVISGTQERPISLRASSVREAANLGGYGSTVSTYSDRRGCPVGRRWMIHGMNHFWPGGSADPAWANWTDPKGPSGAEISWRFFSRYTKHRHRHCS